MNNDAIFISYRRADASAWAMWLESLLQERYGETSVFRDLTSLRVGDRFEQEIHRVLNSCKAAIVVIGPSWLTLNGDSGVQRLFEENDFVRREIERALDRQDVLVIPVLVDGMRMPEARDLPPALAPLAGYQALDLSDARRKQDVAILFDALDGAGVKPAVKPTATQSAAPGPSYMPALAALGMTAAAAVGALLATSPARNLGDKRRGGADFPTRIAAYAAERAVLWAIIGALALAVAYVLLGRGSWAGRIAGAIGWGARGLVVSAFAGGAGGALFIVLQDKTDLAAFSVNCISVTLTGLVLAGAFSKLASESERGYYLLAGLVGGLLTGAIGASKALAAGAAAHGTLSAGGHVLEAVVMFGIFGLTLAGLAMAPSTSRVRAPTSA